MGLNRSPARARGSNQRENTNKKDIKERHKKREIVRGGPEVLKRTTSFGRVPPPRQTVLQTEKARRDIQRRQRRVGPASANAGDHLSRHAVRHGLQWRRRVLDAIWQGRGLVCMARAVRIAAARFAGASRRCA